MKIAILHEMFIKLWGAEKVVESIIKIYPEADIYTLLYDEKKVGHIFPKSLIHKQCLRLPSQRLYNLSKKQRFSLPLMSRSVEALDFSQYDRVIVSSSGFAHGLITKPDTKTTIYYHAPARYMWDRTHEHTRDIGLDSWLRWYIFSKLLLKLRLWDYTASQRNDVLLANSSNTQKRITKYFRRDSQVLYPPVETKRFAKALSPERVKKVFQDTFYKTQPTKDWDSNSCSTYLQNTSFPWWYYIIISALTEFKKIDIAIQAFRNISDTHLVVIGEGDYRTSLEKEASENTSFVWAQFWDNLVGLVQCSLGLIFPGEEDFGIVPIEVMAAGKPVFALEKWGLTETVIAGKTWEFFKDSEWSDFIESFQKFHKNNIMWIYTPKNCQSQAQQFSEEIFKKELQQIINSL